MTKYYRHLRLITGILLLFSIISNTFMLGDMGTVKAANNIKSYIGSSPASNYAKYKSGSTTYTYNIGTFGSTGTNGTNKDKMCAFGYSGTNSADNMGYYNFSNTAYDDDIYVKFPLAVVYGEKRYDLIVYPRKEGVNAAITWTQGFFSNMDLPVARTFSLRASKNSSFYKLVVCEPPDPNYVFESEEELKKYKGKPVKWSGYFGFADVDKGGGNGNPTIREYVCFENGMLDTGDSRHVGSCMEVVTDSTSVCTPVKNIRSLNRFEIFRATAASTDTDETEVFDKNAVYGICTIPTEGAEIAYDGDGGVFGTCCVFDGFIDASITIPEVKSKLNVNPNGGTWEGSTATKVFENVIGASKSISAPTRAGYKFTGWTLSGGGTITDGTTTETYTYGEVAGTIKAKWEALPAITATVKDVSATYTGSPITAPDGITVTSPTSGVTKKYSKTAGSYTTARPSWINADTYTVYYELTANGYTTKTGSYTFTINRAKISVPIGEVYTYDGSSKTGIR